MSAKFDKLTVATPELPNSTIFVGASECDDSLVFVSDLRDSTHDALNRSLRFRFRQSKEGLRNWLLAFWRLIKSIVDARIVPLVGNLPTKSKADPFCNSKSSSREPNVVNIQSTFLNQDPLLSSHLYPQFRAPSGWPDPVIPLRSPQTNVLSILS